MNIPRIIHQVWFGFDGKLEDKPEYYDPHCITKTFCKSHKIGYKLWTRSECEKICEEHYKDLWLSFRHEIQRMDFVRLVILQKFGGIYLDMDIHPINDINHLFDQPDLFVRWKDAKDAYNAIMGSHVGHPIWKECISECQYVTPIKQSMKVYDVRICRLVSQTTGCAMLTRSLKRLGYNYDYYQEIINIINEKKGIKSLPEGAVFQDGSVSGWFKGKQCYHK
jgi:lipopolysaccharide biosynthesis glycosyltransferase